MNVNDTADVTSCVLACRRLLSDYSYLVRDSLLPV